MGSKSDDLKGRAKEAVGDLTGNEDLKREGQADRAAGKAKETVENVAEKAKDVVEKAEDVAADVVEEVKDKVQGADK